MTTRALVLMLGFCAVPAALRAQPPEPALPIMPVTAPSPAIPTSARAYVLKDTADPLTGVPVAMQETRIAIDDAAHCNRNPSPLNNGPLETPKAVEFEDPFNTGLGRVCAISLPFLLPTGNYKAFVTLVSGTCLDPTNGEWLFNCESVRSAIGIPMFHITSPNEGVGCGPDSLNQKPATINVGEWTKLLKGNQRGRVTFSLLLSSHPIVTIITRFNGGIVDQQNGADLRGVAATYYRDGGVKPGSYALTVEAISDNACSDGANRPMTVVVK